MKAFTGTELTFLNLAVMVLSAVVIYYAYEYKKYNKKESDEE